MIGLYISIPFCRQKCTYCNFASGVFPEKLVEPYLRALTNEIRLRVDTSPPDSVYLGGGTPSLLDVAQLDSVFNAVGPRHEAEITIEASPLTVTAEKVRGWVRLGVNRVSLGVQSFVAREAAGSGRKHTASDVAREIAILRAAGIDNINIDLIAGLAYQTEAGWEESLDWVERLRPPHVSVYMLEVDDESRLGEEIRAGGNRFGAEHVPSDDQIAAFYDRAVERLDNMGVGRYEISNFAAPGRESRHNLKYWNMQPYVGFGADAHSFDGRRRWANVAAAAEYVERAGRGESPQIEALEIGPRRRGEDKFITGLRQMAGVQPTPPEWRRFGESLERLRRRGWLLHTEDGRVRLTAEGVMFSNEVCRQFLAD